MKFVIKMLVLGSLPLLLFACGPDISPSRSTSGATSSDTDTNTNTDTDSECRQKTGIDKDTCLDYRSNLLPTQIRETPRPA